MRKRERHRSRFRRREQTLGYCWPNYGLNSEGADFGARSVLSFSHGGESPERGTARTPPRSQDVSGCQRCVSECLNLLQFCHRGVTDMSRAVTEMSPIGHKLVTRCHGDVAACHTEISHDMIAACYTRRVVRYSNSQNFVSAQTINVITRCHVSRHFFKSSGFDSAHL